MNQRLIQSVSLACDNGENSPCAFGAALDGMAPWLEAVDVIVQQYLVVQQRRGDDRFDMQSILMSTEEVEGAGTRAPLGYPRWLGIRRELPYATDHSPQLTGLLADVANRFGLTRFDIFALILGLMPILEPRYGSLLAYVQGDDQAPWPHVDLILSLFGTARDYAVQRVRLTAADQPLLYGGLMYMSERSGRASDRSDALYLRTADAVVTYLSTGHVSLSKNLVDLGNWLSADGTEPMGQSAVWQAARERVSDFCYENIGSVTPVLMLGGGEGAESLLAQVAGNAGRQALLLDLAGLPGDSTDAWPVLLEALHLTRLSGSMLVLRGLGEFEQRHAVLLRGLDARLRDHGQPVVAIVANDASGPALRELARLRMSLPPRSSEENASIVQGALIRRGWLETGEPLADDVAKLLKRTSVEPDMLDYAMDEAQWYALQREPKARVSGVDVCRALRTRAQQDFGSLAQRVEPSRGLQDLIVGDALREQLDEILIAVRQRDGVLADGFLKKLVYGVGISALFHGDPGTGKSMAAEALAYELGVDLIRVDLSTVVNKYIGETEKNLSKIFNLAHKDAGVLLFDEADALFGKRGQVKDAQDRHANIQVSYLLQRLEHHPGLVVLSTNNRGHLDEAFTRRLTFMTRFDLPDAALRARMWQAIWPAHVERANGIDWAGLGHRMELSGAGIRNVALLASWLAADSGRAVTLADIERAARRELGKTGRIMAG
ncbi:AAA ATPase central domain protein [Burkholderia ambifaria MEX-5]|uniref:AAA ATPase central domain protein n=2 Tax=Burkholderia ambifaria TaxID=152480 RepID=B1TGQ2_9BURK|nr:AAA ATPase central domain protein [Burkholderia ambifaria MEX-5]